MEQDNQLKQAKEKKDDSNLMSGKDKNTNKRSK